jgi:hypothetical protein
VRVTLPQLREGKYGTALVTADGQSRGTGPDLRVLGTDPPVVSKVVPGASYPRGGYYSFELVGEHFSPRAKDNQIRVNDVLLDFARYVDDVRDELESEADCGSVRPCLIGGRRLLRIYGLSVTDARIFRPMKVSVQVDNLISSERPLVLSPVGRWAPAVIAFVVLALLTAGVYFMARDKAGRYRVGTRTYATFAYIFIEPQSNTFSLSRLQLLIWTAATVVGYTYLAASQMLVQWTWVLPDVPEGLPTLMGISAGTTAIAAGTEMQRSKGAGPVHPSLGDFITTGGVFAPERLQFFLWTLLGAAGFVSATLAQDPALVTQLPKIPDNFAPLMGISSLGYLAGKVLRKSGPVIRQLIPPAPFTGTAEGVAPTPIRVVGEHLSPKAIVRVNGELLPATKVGVPAPQPADAEFVTELVLTPDRIISPGPGVAAVKVTNPDGQAAEL